MRRSSVEPGAILFEGSGACIPPVEVDRTLCLVGPGAEEPFADYRWSATVRPVLGEADLYDVAVAVAGPGTDYTVATRFYRPRPLGAL